MFESVPDIVIHMIFSTKGQQPVIAESFRPEVKSHISTALKLFNSPALIIGVLAEHVHILSGLDLDHSVDELIREAKKRSATCMRNAGPECEEFDWQLGYASFTVSRSRAEKLGEYIANQDEYHQEVSFKDEYRRLLAEHELEYDEGEMWE